MLGGAYVSVYNTNFVPLKQIPDLTCAFILDELTIQMGLIDVGLGTIVTPRNGPRPGR